MLLVDFLVRKWLMAIERRTIFPRFVILILFEKLFLIFCVSVTIADARSNSLLGYYFSGNGLFFHNTGCYPPPSEFRRRYFFVFHGDHREEFFEFLRCPLFIIFFPSAEPELNLHRVPLFQKFFELPHLDQEIVVRGARTDLDLLESLTLLREPFFFLCLFALIAVLVKTHEARHGRMRSRHDLDQINALFGLRERERFLARHHAKILAGLIEYPEFRRGYFIVDFGRYDGRKRRGNNV